MDNRHNFTEGEIFRPLIRFALPILLALFLQAMYGGVDLLVVGRFAETADVSGVSTGSQIMQVVTFCTTSLAMGITILVGQAIGRGKPDEANRVIGSGVCLFAVLAVGLSALMVVFAGPLARLMHAPDEALSQTCAYIRICGAGTVFISAYNLLGSIFRGLGDSKMPLVTVTIACVINIFGDLLLVAVFGMGAAGAALATVASQAVSVLLSFLIIRRRKILSLTRRDLRFDRTIIWRILKLGVPISLQDFLVGISFLILLIIVNSKGLVASAGMGVAEKVCTFIMLVPCAASQSLAAFVAQNIGAARPDRAKKALRYGMGVAAVFGVAMSYLAFFHGDTVSLLFTKDALVAAASHSYLKAYGIDCLIAPFLFSFFGYYSGCGKTAFVMFQGIFGAFCVRIPVAYFMSRLPGATLFMIGLGTPASSVVQLTLCLIMFVWYGKHDAFAPVE